MGTDALRGALELLVLKTLSRGAAEGMHGFGIAERIQQVSQEHLRVEEGSLYPALHRMEQAGWIAAKWGCTANRRRARYYRLTPAGRRQLAEQEEAWRHVTAAVTVVLEAC